MKGRKTSQKTLDFFLKQLAAGLTVSAAATASGIAVRTATTRRAKDPEFAARWKEAYEAGVDALEEEARRRAVEGVEKPLFNKGLPVFETDPKTGEVKRAHVREYSDVLLMMLLKARDPLRFCERARSAAMQRKWEKDDRDASTPGSFATAEAVIKALEAFEASKAALADHGTYSKPVSQN